MADSVPLIRESNDDMLGGLSDWIVIDQKMRAGRKGSMRQVCLVVLLIGLLGLGIEGGAGAAGAADSKMRILTPTPGAVIKGDSVEVRYELAKGVHATHVHCYVDGEYQRGYTGVVKGLARGKHEIKLVAAGHDHQVTAAEALVVIEVE